MINSSVRIVIAGDLFPSENNIKLFEEADAEALYGKEVCRMFAKADFSIANLEGALTDSTVAQQKDGPVIKAPKATIAGIKNLGLSALALANNHITDYQQQGIDDTLDILNDAGILYVGIAPKKGCSSPPVSHVSITINDKKICVYNVSETFFNKPTKEMAGAYVYDEWIVLNEIKALKQRHDFIIVIYHGGAEYLPYPTPQTRTRFHRMADCGADFITAQHTHCIGCEEWYNGSYLLHGQGNFHFARQKKYLNLTRQGLIAEITITDNGFSVNNHIVTIKDNVLCYDDKQDLTPFYERSKRLNDEDYIIEQYSKVKVEEIMRMFLVAAKGSYPLRRITRRLFPNSVKHPEHTYTLPQMLRNFNLVQGERTSEDMYYVWKYLLNNYTQYGK
ncbi:CapA family protein [Prevotella sp. E9-3]|uniref:CapA family protein n=1 Tax=Prevotella sp. E9-3 TaxID=2913621 RepID=UPI001EDBA345|nr:CapA family protein [Prevotella sp. E9-3]UKK49479.1 CapA family protein [Prevotella sp. E9-3]